MKNFKKLVHKQKDLAGMIEIVIIIKTAACTFPRPAES